MSVEVTKVYAKQNALKNYDFTQKYVDKVQLIKF